MENTTLNIKKLENVSIDKIRVAYALNLCTVSVSQIVDYNDLYILEQEYDAILNNLNLEMMPKDDALLKTLTEILNTITFFRIQDIKKNQIEKDYQRNLRNAIWSAIPNLSIVISGNPISSLIAMATQVGIGYMNYRKEKATILSDKEKAEIELEITAIEQLNALRRELFTSAWKLADKYDFPDSLRLTEKQIKQYNQILLDTDNYRKFARLEAIKDKFYAYPPFWYHFAHTALTIATSNSNEETKEIYKKKAETCFELFQTLNIFNVLREDQITASANLEYIELLLLEKNPDCTKIKTIIDNTVEKCGNANDIIQICAVDYLRIGENEPAEKLFKILVNEDFNSVSNAKILSRIYASRILRSNDEEEKKAVKAEYNILNTRINNPYILYPMPSDTLKTSEDALNEKFTNTQKELLKREYRLSLDAFKKKSIVEFNSVIPAPFKNGENKNEYYNHTIKAKEKRIQDIKKILSSKSSTDYILRFKEIGFREGYINVFNKIVSEMEFLKSFKALKKHDDLIKNIEKRIINSRKELIEIQQKLDNETFKVEDYINLCNEFSFEYFLETFFEKSLEYMLINIDNAIDLEELDTFETDLMKFCEKSSLPDPQTYINTEYKVFTEKEKTIFFNFESLGIHENNSDFVSLNNYLYNFLKESLPSVIINAENISIYFSGDKQFDTYFENNSLHVYSGSTYLIRTKTFAIIDDLTRKDSDLLLCEDGIRLVENNHVKDISPYNYIGYNKSGNKSELKLAYPEIYTNKNINIGLLYSTINSLAEKIINFKTNKGE